MLGSLSLQAAATKEKIMLTNSILKRIDGVPYMMDGATIRDILHVRREGRKIHYGLPNKQTRKMEGKYTYQGERYSIHQLAEIEREIDQWYAEEQRQLDQRHLRCQELDQDIDRSLHSLRTSLKEELEEGLEQIQAHGAKDAEEAELRMRRKFLKRLGKRSKKIKEELCTKYGGSDSSYKEATRELKMTYDAKLQPLNECLLIAREDFKDINRPYLQQLHGTKSFLQRLVIDSCMKRKRYDSFLLKWAEVPEGQEFRELDATMTRIQFLDIFLEDLSNFFEDLVHSCPQGWKQYLELVKQQ
jgi:hypothetical protein